MINHITKGLSCAVSAWVMGLAAGIARAREYLFQIRVVWAALLLGVCIHSVRAESAQPNIVIILSDDQGWGDLSVNGNSNLATPNIDSLAKDGALFDRFYVCAVCSPTRAEFLTGRYHPRGGVTSTGGGGERLNLDEITIAQTFKSAGYATAAFGKWHNGSQFPYHPKARGFDEFYGFCSGHWGHYFSPMLDHNGEMVRGNGFGVDDFTDQAMAFMEKHRPKPFFCYIPYNTPHSPMQVPDQFYKKFENAKLDNHTKAAYAMCENIDWNVGRILMKLEDLNIAENTIVIYFSDNGPNGNRWNGEMKGKKGSTDEGGVRVPFLIRWPARIKPGTRVPQISAAIDLLPTLSDIAGIKPVGDKPLDGISLRPLLEGTAAGWPDRMIFNYWNRLSVRTQQYRLDDKGKLYDMVKDPGQHNDVSAQHPEVTATLKAAGDKWTRDVFLQRGNQGSRSPTVGGVPVTWLPADDGKESGDIKRSSRHPNCSYFTNWTKPSENITWSVDVLTAGEYTVELWYTCPTHAIGSTLTLKSQSGTVRAKIIEPNDPPAIGAAEDRSPRTESLVKDFKPIRLGVLRLEKGDDKLILSAADIPGSSVAEVRYLKLTLKKEEQR